MNWDSLMKKLPEPWRPLFSILSSKSERDPAVRAAEWWQDATTSQYGSADLVWAELLADLTHRGPFLNGINLVFRPVFYQFPCDIQRLLLAFVHMHRYQIPSKTLREFMDVLKRDEFPKSDWTEGFLSILEVWIVSRDSHCISERNNADDMEQDVSPEFRFSMPSAVYGFSKMNSSHATELCSQLSAETWTKRAGINLASIWNAPCPFVSFEHEEHDPVGDDELAFALMDYENCLVPSQLDVNSNVQQQQHSVVVIADDGSQVSSQQISCEGALIDDSIAPDAGNVRTELNPDLMAAMLVLKGLWCDGVNNADVFFLLNLPASQLESVLNAAGVADLSDIGVSCACQCLVAVATQFGYENCCVFAKCCLLPRLSALQQPASRLLAASLSSFLETFPRQSIRSIFLPVVLSRDCNSCQADVVTKASKDSLAVEHKLEFLSEILSDSNVLWSEPALSILQLLVDSKVALSDTDVGRLVVALCTNCSVHSASPRFGKLLLAAVNVYGTRLTSMHIQQLQQLADAHKSFVKKSVLAALAKL